LQSKVITQTLEDRKDALPAGVNVAFYVDDKAGNLITSLYLNKAQLAKMLGITDWSTAGITAIDVTLNVRTP
jgi:hypothetical protein